jgi:hypothetical protein
MNLRKNGGSAPKEDPRLGLSCYLAELEGGVFVKRNIWIFGSALGIGLCINLFYTLHLFYGTAEFKDNAVLGYTIMVVVFSLTFFGIRNYRDKRLGGVISFGMALRTGALIVLVASTMYVVVWLFSYYLFVPDFMDKYVAHCLNQATRDGATAAELAIKTQEMEKFRGMYKNPLMVILLTYMEVLPMGLAVTLVSSFVLKRKAKPGLDAA